MANGLIDVGILRPELAGAFGAGYRESQQQRNALVQQQQAQQLHDLQIQNALREQRLAGEEEAAYKAAGNDLGRLQTELFQRGLGKQGLAVGAQQAKQLADRMTMLKNANDLKKNTATSIFAEPTLENAILRTQQFGQQTGMDVTPELQRLQQIGNNPEAIKQWAAGHAMEADKLMPKFQEFSTPGGGKQIGSSNPITGKFTADVTFAPRATPGELLTDARSRERLQAEMATNQLTPESLDVAANVYLQTGQLPTGLGKAAAGLRSQVMNRATELSGGKPAADVAGDIVGAKLDVAGRGKAIKDFSTGKQGDTVRSFNTAIDHLDTLGKAAAALQNNDIRAFNTLGNAIAAATGQAAPTDFDSVRTIVGGEVAKAVTGSQMALKDREEIRESLNRANSPAQLAGVIRRAQELMGGQLNSLNLQYETSTGRKDFDKKLTPRSKEVVQGLRNEQPAGKSDPLGIR